MHASPFLPSSAPRALFALVLLAGSLGVGAACSSSDDDATPGTGDSGPGSGSGEGGAGSSSGGASSGGSSSGAPNVEPGARCRGTTRTVATDVAQPPTVPQSLAVPAGFVLEGLASLTSPRHLAALPNGDLLVGTQGNVVMLVPHADGDRAGTPTEFVRIDDAPLNGVTFDAPSCTVYVGSQHGIYRVAYEDGMTQAEPGEPIARVRPGGEGGHVTTSVAVSGGMLYAGVGSVCNACTETDPTRATVQRMNLDGTGMATFATRIRNPIGLTVNTNTGTLWVGNAGQDSLPAGHPYEFFDAIGTHPAGVDYGWPECEENQKAYVTGADCSNTVEPDVVLPAFSTLISAAFYPSSPTGAHAFPAEYRGGAFVAARGAWHETDGKFFSPPRIAFVKMNGDAPAAAVDWNDPATQWSEFVSGFELPDRATRVARATGTAVGPDGSLFVSDDDAGLLLRVRPAR